MCVKMKPTELRQMIQSRCTRISIDGVIAGLKITGSMSETVDGQVELEDDYPDWLREMCKPVETGDIVYVMNLGFYLVIDRHPESANGNDLMRVLPVSYAYDGTFHPVKNERTSLVSPKDVTRVRKSKFDTDTINHLTYQRYLAYKKIDECNDALYAMREQE